MKRFHFTLLLILNLILSNSYAQNWGSWENLKDGWENKLSGRQKITNQFRNETTEYEIKNEYAFSVHLRVTFTFNDGENGTWEQWLDPNKIRNWALKTTYVKKVEVSINEYKGPDGNYYKVGEAAGTPIGKFKLSYDAQVSLRNHYNLLDAAPTIKKYLAASPFAFLFLGGTPRPDEVFEFPWVEFANACKDVKNIISQKIKNDASENCAQFSGSGKGYYDQQFWCKLAEIYNKN